MESLRYGIIGLGFFGEKHAAVAANLPYIDLRAVCSRRDERRLEIKQRFGVPADYRDYNDLLADPDIEAVSVVTHVDEHAEPTLAALKAGKHVLVEKPMARTAADCDRMIAAAEKANRILMVGHICRFNPRYAVARKRIADGAVGQIVSMFARRNIPAERSQAVLEKLGPLLGDGVHDVDLMLWMSGARVESVYALTHSYRNLQNPDLGWAMFRFEGGAVGVVENVWCLPAGTPFRIHEEMEVIGTEGALYIHGSDQSLALQTPQGIDCPDTQYWPEMHGEPVGALRREISYFADCVLGGMKPTVATPLDGRAAVEAMAAAEKSARLGGKVIRLNNKP